MKRTEGGFTLIELVMVIVILGILAATALPKFVDLKGDAQKAAVQGMAASLASGSSMNYARRLINTANGSAVANCTDTSNLVDNWPTSYTLSGGTLATTSSAAPGTCTVVGDSQTVTFIAYGS